MTWVVRAVITSPEPAVVALNVQPGEAVHLGDVDLHRHYIRGGVAHEYPPRPGPWAVWDGGPWVDPRSPSDLAAELEARRNAASITRSAFLQACISVGLLNPAEAAEAARGDIPAPFEMAIADLPAEQRDMIPVIWPAVTWVDRVDPLTLGVVAHRDIGAELLDQIFGVADPSGVRFEDG